MEGEVHISSVQEELTVKIGRLIDLSRKLRSVCLQERVGRREVEHEIEGAQHKEFHLADLVVGVGLPGHVDVVSQRRRVNLLVLAGDQHGGDT